MADKREILNVGGMSCEMCAKSVARALKTLDGVHHVKVELDDDLVEVDYDESKVELAALKKAVEEAGYDII